MDKLYGLSDNILDEICGLAEKYNICKVIIFGSRARGDYKDLSDIDLAVSGGDTVNFSLAVGEETSTLLFFDIVNLDGAVQYELLSSIKRDGKVIYEKVR